MPTRIDYNGDIRQLPSKNALWSSTGGSFTSGLGTTTYFPIPLSYSDFVPTASTYTVPLAHENRPDLIANELYGSSDYWWLVLWATKIVDPFSIKVGTVIRVVSINDINTLLG